MRSAVGQWEIIEILNKVYSNYTRASADHQAGLAEAWKVFADYLRPGEDNLEPVFLERDYPALKGGGE